MAFCSKCGAQINEGAAFCAACGNAVGPSAGTGPVAPGTTSSGMTDNVAGALAYILGIITGILFLVIEPYNKSRFVRFHAFQSIFFCIAWWILWVALRILAGFMLFGLIWSLMGLLAFAGFLYWLFVMYKAYNHEEYRIPFIGDLAAKQAGN